VRAVCEPVLVGAGGVLAEHARRCRLSLKGLRVLETEEREFALGEVRPEHGLAAIDAARTAIRGALAGEYAAVVAAPQSETAVHAAGIEFDGYPSFVARETGLPPERGILMLCFRHGGRELRIAHATLHASVRECLERLTRDSIFNTLRAVHECLPRLGVAKPRIAVSGVNPHAGEGGLFGDEEEKLVMPAIEAARAEGMTVDGPVGADTLFRREGYDAFVVMLHDQGHIAAKLLAPQRVAGLTIGTPVLFSSVAHGAAFDIAGKNRAEPAAMIEAVTRLVGRRRRARATARNP
jgi:4-hydroxy-L-threonine phosphate dehydrogenase PdxA